MFKHIEEDEVITEKRVKTIENVLNKHADFWVGITNAGETSGQTKRIKGNLKTKDNQIPVLSGASKDHKKVEDNKIGPDVRPIMGAMVGPNVCISNLGSMVVRAIANNYDDGHMFSRIINNEDVFKAAIPPYQNALNMSGYDYVMKYEETQATQKEKKNRKRRIIWYNPPWSVNCSTKIGAKFLNLVDTCFPQTTPFIKCSIGTPLRSHTVACQIWPRPSPSTIQK